MVLRLPSGVGFYKGYRSIWGGVWFFLMQRKARERRRWENYKVRTCTVSIGTQPISYVIFLGEGRTVYTFLVHRFCCPFCTSNLSIEKNHHHHQKKFKSKFPNPEDGFLVRERRERNRCSSWRDALKTPIADLRVHSSSLQPTFENRWDWLTTTDCPPSFPPSNIPTLHFVGKRKRKRQRLLLATLFRFIHSSCLLSTWLRLGSCPLGIWGWG